MSQQINIALNFSANTQQAQASLQNLQTQLTKIAYGSNDIKVNPGQIEQASSAAKELAFHLNQAYNANTGNIDLTRLQTSLKSAGTSVTQLSSNLLSAGRTGQQAFVSLAQSIAMAEAPVLRVNNLVSNLWRTFGNTLRYQLSSNVISGFTQAISGAVSYVKELDTSLNNIRIVTGYSAEEMSKFAVEANKAAKALSTTTTAYTDASLIFYQQGLTGDAVKERADVVVKLANVTGQSAEIVSDQMTAIWNNFDDGSKSMEYYADVITKLGAATASSTDEISDGLEKFAAVAETVGLSYEMATASLATVTAETRQSADVVGTAFKTIFSRMEGLQLGETLEDGTTLNKYSEALAIAGVNIKEQNGQMKEMDNILSELGTKWQTLGKDQQIALAQAVAGVRQYNQFIALMSNWDKVQENLGVAAGSTGELNTQAEIFADSWEAAKNRVTASLEAVYSDIFKEDFFKDFMDTMAHVLNGIDGFLDGVGGIGPVLMGVASVALGMFANQVPAALQGLKNNLLITFGQGAKVINQMNAETQELIQNELNVAQSGRSYTELQKQQLTNAANLSNLKAKLALADKNLSDAERTKYNFEIQGIQLQQQELEGLADIITKEKERINILKEQLSINQQKINSNNTDSEHLKRLQRTKTNVEGRMTFLDANPDLQEDNNEYAQLEAQLERINAAIERAKIRSQEFTSYMQTAAQGLSSQFAESLSSEGFSKTMESSFDLDTSKITSKLEEFKYVTENGLSSIDFSPIRNSVQTISEAFTNENGELTAEGKKMIETVSKIEEKLFTSKDKRGRNKMIESLIKQLTGIKVPGQQAQKVLKALSIEMDELVGSAKKADEATGKLTEAEKRLKQQIDQIDFKHTVKGTEALSSAMSGIGSMVFGLQSLSSAFEALTNPDLSGWDKFLSVTMSLTMAFPMFTSGLKNLGTTMTWLKGIFTTQAATQEALLVLTNKEITADLALQTLQKLGLTQKQAEVVQNKILEISKSNLTKEEKEQAIMQLLISNGYQKKIGLGLKDVVTTKLQTWATKVKTKADQGETSALWAKFAALVATNWILLAIVAVLAILIVAIVAITAALKKAEEPSLDEKLEKTREASENLKTAIEELKSAIEELNSAWNSYEDSVNALDKLTKGSQEWYEQIEKINNQVNDLLTKYPELMDMVHLDENGMLVLDKEGYEDFVKEKQDKQNDLKLGLQSNQENEEKLEGEKVREELPQALNTTFNTPNNSPGGPPSKQIALSTILQEGYDNNWIDKNEELTSEKLAKLMYKYQQENEGIDFGFNEKYIHNGQLLIPDSSSLPPAMAGLATPFDLFDLKLFGNSYIGLNTAADEYNKQLKLVQNKEKIGEEYSTGGALVLGQNYLKNKKDSEGTILTEKQGAEAASVSYGKKMLEDTEVKYEQDYKKYETQNFDESAKEKIKSHYDTIYGKGATTFDGNKIMVNGEEQDKISTLRGLAASEVRANLESGNYAQQASKDWSKVPQWVSDYFSGKGMDIEDIEGYKKDETGEITIEGKTLSEYFNSNDFQALTKYGLNIDNIKNSIAQGETRLDTFNKTWESSLNDEEKKWFNDLSKEDQQEAIKAAEAEVEREKKDGEQSDLGRVKTAVYKASKGRDKKEYEDIAEAVDDENLTGDAVKEYSENLKKLGEVSKLSEKELKALTKVQLRFDKGIAQAQKTLEDNKDNLKENKKGTTEYSKACSELATGLNEIFGENAFDAQSVADNLGDVKDALNGDAEAYNRLQKVAVTNKLKEQLETIPETLQDTIDAVTSIEGIDVGELITVDDTLDTNSLAYQLTDMYNQAYDAAIAGGMSATQAIEYANAMMEGAGFAAPEMEEKTVTLTGDIPDGWTPQEDGTVVTTDASGNQVTVKGVKAVKTENGQYTYTQTMLVPKKKSGFTKTRETIKPSGSKSGGGGGGSKKETKEFKKKDNEIERYYEVNNSLETMGKMLDRISNKKEHAFGKDKIKLMEDEYKILEKELKLQKQYEKEIEANLKKDKQAVLKLGFTVDTTGNINNYDEIMNKWIDEYNAAIQKYNNSAQSEADKKALEEFEKRHEERVKILEQYEETLDLSYDAENDRIAKQNEMIQQATDIFIEAQEQRVEAFEKAIDAYDSKLDYLSKKMERLEEKEFQQAKAASLLGSSIETSLNKTQDNISAYYTALSAWNDIKDGVDSKGKKVSEEAKETAWENLKSAAEALGDSQDELLDFQQQLSDLVISYLENQAEAFDELSEKVEFLNGLLENYANIMELLGRKYEDFDIIQSIADNQVAASQRSLEIAKAEYNRLLEEMEEIRETGDEEAIKEITAQVDEARTAMLDAWSAGLEAVAHQYEVSITNLVKTTEKQLSKFYSLEEAQEFYDQNKSIAELYLEEYDSLYQLNKLTRDINKSMRDQDSLLTNQKLSTLLDEINEKRLSGAQMSQHEVDMLQKKYNLRLAEIALEEAQNAKSQMRLTRDASGNWSYTYTADQSKIDEATQKHEDALYEIKKSSKEYIDEMSEAILANEQAMMEAIKEVDQTSEDYLNIIEAIRKHHLEKNQFYYSEIEKAIGDVNTAYGEEKIAFEDLTIAKIKNINSANEGLNTFEKSTITLLKGMVEAYRTHSKGVEEFATTMGEDIGQAVKGIGDEIATTDDKMKDLVKTIKNSFSDMMSKLSPIFETLSTAIDGTVNNLDKLIENFLKLQNVQGRANTGYYDESIDYNSELTSMALKKGSDASSGEFAQYLWERGNKVKTGKYKKYANMGHESYPFAAALMAAADRNDTIKNWVSKTQAGTVTVKDARKAEDIMRKYNKDFDYSEIMTAWLLAGGDPSNDKNGWFKIMWNHFNTKLDTETKKGKTFREYYFDGKSGEELWEEFLSNNEYLSAEAIPYPFDTGGYTGEWGPEGKLAILHQKELVLNAGDTENFLKSMELMGHIISIIDRNTMLAAAGLALGQPTAAAVNDKVVQQTVAIEASFPGVQSAAEIEQALNNIVNDAAQYASIRKN